MLKELLKKNRQHINYFFEHLDIDATERMLNMLLGCQGKIFLTGIGKSGLVAKKIALTMASTGTPALYLSAANAMHGDIGIVSDKDIFIMLSKSGESDELINLIPHVKNKGTQLIGIVSNAKSRLVRACNLSITLPLEQEICPFDLAPTTSTAIQMIFGDVLAIALMQHKNFTLDQYALNHPAGRIGKRTSLKVKDIMLTGANIPTCQPEDKLVDSLVELSNKRCGCILVINSECKLQGIFTDGDLRRALQKQGPVALDSIMSQVMTLAPQCIGPEARAWEAMKRMEAHPLYEITVLPVIEDDKKLVGLIKLHDIIQSGL